MRTQTEPTLGNLGSPRVRTWRDELADKIPADQAAEIDTFETQMALRQQGKVEEKLFAETRLRRGVYGQRYDNGERHDGTETRLLQFPQGSETKGPSTCWDAPGMQRIKIPYGALTAGQLEVLADLAEEYSDAILHITTRQDIQLHFVHIEDTPDLMRRLAAVGITTREACGNSVRNITACPISGVCGDETFDVSPYAHATTYFLLGHPDVQDFGRKFKIAFSGCHQHACGLTAMHDIGAIATIREGKRGFAFYVGGGLGAVPHQARLFAEFLPEEELLPMAQAIGRVFARLGEKKNRAKARIKFLVQRLGIEEFRRLVLEERERLPHDPRWTSYLERREAAMDAPASDPSPLPPGPHPEGFEDWHRTNVSAQKQDGYAVATARLPLGDMSSVQARAMADLSRELGISMRTTVEQNLVFRWVPHGALPAVYERLSESGLGAPGAGTISDITACPGTDTCKLGISSSRGLAAELTHQLDASSREIPEAARGLRIKASGCFNACGQHHISDIGFLGVSRNVGGRRVPHFQVVLGGQWRENAGAFGLSTVPIPSKRIPEVVERITQVFSREREADETFQDFIRRIGKARVRELLQDLMQVPAYDLDRSFYSDWGDPREYTIKDMGVGECAGEVVSPVEFGLSDSELQIFEAQLQLDQGESDAAARRAFSSMLQAAKTLVRIQFWDVPDEPERIVAEFRERFHDTKVFHDPYAGGKFAHYLFRAHGEALDGADTETARRRIEEAQLFIEAAHACYDRMLQAGIA